MDSFATAAWRDESCGIIFKMVRGPSWLASSHCQLDRALMIEMKVWCHCIFDGYGIFVIDELVSGANGSRRSC